MGLSVKGHGLSVLTGNRKVGVGGTGDKHLGGRLGHRASFQLYKTSATLQWLSVINHGRSEHRVQNTVKIQEITPPIVIISRKQTVCVLCSYLQLLSAVCCHTQNKIQSPLMAGIALRDLPTPTFLVLFPIALTGQPHPLLSSHTPHVTVEDCRQHWLLLHTEPRGSPHPLPRALLKGTSSMRTPWAPCWVSPHPLILL